MPNTVTLRLETVEGKGLRFGVEASGRHAITDSGADRTAPTPVELLLVALAGCTAMDAIAILRKKRQQVTAYEVVASGERRAEHPRAFTRIEVVHRFAGRDLAAEAIRQAIELSRTKYCSVSASIDPAIVVTHRFEILPA